MISSQNYKKLALDDEQVKEAKNIANNVYWPLTGFLKSKDFNWVVSEMRLESGAVWPIPIVLDIDKQEAERVRGEEKILLVDKKERPVALLKNPEIYEYSKDFFAKNVFGTKKREHPGVDGVFNMKELLIGGEIELLDKSREPFSEYNFTPAETKRIFQQRGWKTVVAFQTRNAPHRGHEFLQKQALKMVDGLFIQPVIGEKKIADFKDEYILAAYEVLIDRYYPKNKVHLGILPLRMRYAGPREAVFHALIRKNFGASHFIVGRDHAGVGDFYPPFAAQEIFNNFKKEEIGIEIIKFPEVVYFPEQKRHVFKGEAPEDKVVSFSGTKLRGFVKNREQPPSWLIRPEVYYFLTQSANSLVDEIYKKRRDNKKGGFVVWFTGFSQSGKTSVANALFQALSGRGLKVERLDGDIVRQYLSKDLGFSKEDRDENIRRIGFVSRILAKRGLGVVLSFISPFRKQREEVRQQVESAGARFIEVFCNCPIEVCEQRDTKGLYEKAKKGEIKNFTGISDPYEPPENPEIELRTDKEDIGQCAEKVLNYLGKNGII